MKKISFHLNISQQQFLNWYKGSARQVTTVADNGKRISFPAEKLRPFVDHQGVVGHFEISFNENHKFVALKRLQQ